MAKFKIGDEVVFKGERQVLIISQRVGSIYILHNPDDLEYVAHATAEDLERGSGEEG